MSAHTPGPWLRDTKSGINCDVRAESGRKVVLCLGLRTANPNEPKYRDECDANAKLIASAPDLLEQLIYLRNCIESGTRPAMSSVNSAISKAMVGAA